MARLRTSAMVVSTAINVRTEGLGVRATGRSFGKSHATIIRWERRVAQQVGQWSAPAPDGADITLEGDEVYTHASENLPPVNALVRRSTSLSAEAATGLMLGQGKKRTNCLSKELRKLGSGQNLLTLSGGLPMENGAMAKLYGKSASVRLKTGEFHPDYGRRKVWRQGLEVAMKIKGSQGRKRVEWVKVEHPFTALSPAIQVNANHNEAQNSADELACKCLSQTTKFVC